VTAQASFNPRNGLVVPAPAPDTPEAVDAVVATAAAAAEPMAAVPPDARRLSARLAEIAGKAMAGVGVTTGPFGIVHGFDAGTRQ
jgi:acyl-CoA reductase-like NAD-dependent aldehyde dehydrogenase